MLLMHIILAKKKIHSVEAIKCLTTLCYCAPSTMIIGIENGAECNAGESNFTENVTTIVISRSINEWHGSIFYILGTR